MAIRRVLVRVEAVFPGLLRLIIPSWNPDVPLYVLRQSLPADVDRKVLSRGGYLFVQADLDKPTATELIGSFNGWQWAVAPRSDSDQPDES